MRNRSREAVTLLEVCVVLAMLGVLLSVAAASLTMRSSISPGDRAFGEVVRHARMRALRDGRPITIGVTFANRVVQIAVSPGGTIVTDGRVPPDSTAAAVLWEANASFER